MHSRRSCRSHSVPMFTNVLFMCLPALNLLAPPAFSDDPLNVDSVRFLNPAEALLQYHAKFEANEHITRMSITVSAAELEMLRNTARFELGEVDSSGTFTRTPGSRIVGWSVVPAAGFQDPVLITVTRPQADAATKSLLRLSFRVNTATVKSDFQINVPSPSPPPGNKWKSEVSVDVESRMLITNNTRADWGEPSGTLTASGFGFPKNFVSPPLPAVAASGGSVQLSAIEALKIKKTLSIKSVDLKPNQDSHPTFSVIAKSWPDSFTQSGAISLFRDDSPIVSASSPNFASLQKKSVGLGELEIVSVTRSPPEFGDVQLKKGKLVGFDRRRTTFASAQKIPDMEVNYVAENGWFFVADSDSVAPQNGQQDPIRITNSPVEQWEKKSRSVDLHLQYFDDASLGTSVASHIKMLEDLLSNSPLIGDSMNRIQQQQLLQCAKGHLQHIDLVVNRAIVQQKKNDTAIRAVVDAALLTARTPWARQELDCQLRELRELRNRIRFYVLDSVKIYNQELDNLAATCCAPSAGTAGPPPPSKAPAKKTSAKSTSAGPGLVAKPPVPPVPLEADTSSLESGPAPFQVLPPK